MRRTLAVLLVLAGVAVFVFLRPDSDPGQYNPYHQKELIQKIEKGQALDKCDGSLIKFLGHTEPIQQGVSEKVLDSGAVGHFPGTGPLGEGNYALTGHVVTHGEPFRYMPNLSKGDRVTVTKCGRKYTFVVDNRFNVYYTNVGVLNYKPKTLTLVTCASRVVHTNYRTVVTARLTTVS